MTEGSPFLNLFAGLYCYFACSRGRMAPRLLVHGAARWSGVAATVSGKKYRDRVLPLIVERRKSRRVKLEFVQALELIGGFDQI